MSCPLLGLRILHHVPIAMNSLVKPLNSGMQDILQELDLGIIARWCKHHNFSEQIIREWFLEHG